MRTSHEDRGVGALVWWTGVAAGIALSIVFSPRWWQCAAAFGIGATEAVWHAWRSARDGTP